MNMKGYYFFLIVRSFKTWASQVIRMVKYPPANTGDIRDMGSIPGSERSSGEGHGNSLEFSSLENPMDRRAWLATVNGGHKGLDMPEATEHA